MVVACTQEAPAVRQALAEQARPRRRRSGSSTSASWRGWSRGGDRRRRPRSPRCWRWPALPEPEPVPAVSYRSAGQLLVVGPPDAALRWAEQLKGQLEVSVLVDRPRAGAELPAPRATRSVLESSSGSTACSGAFEVAWEQENPIDLDLCTPLQRLRPGLPGAGDRLRATRSIRGRCRAHRACVAACGAIGAIDFARAGRRAQRALRPGPGPVRGAADPRCPIRRRATWRRGATSVAQAKAVLELAPTRRASSRSRSIFDYKASICAHSAQSQIAGCNRCIDVCSTGGHPRRRRRRRRSSRTCAWAAAAAPRCVRRVRCATPTRACRDLGCASRRCSRPTRGRGRRDACILFHGRGTLRPAAAQLGRRGAGPAGAGDSAGGARHRLRWASICCWAALALRRQPGASVLALGDEPRGLPRRARTPDGASAT
ncbi:MAG: hypothetical protein MZW92_49740 [Comamonadaceae bacterium]|nr:hypothetical protein [Comamonadaceae bacterium]